MKKWANTLNAVKQVCDSKHCKRAKYCGTRNTQLVDMTSMLLVCSCLISKTPKFCLVCLLFMGIKNCISTSLVFL